VRHRSTQIVALLQDEEKLKEERKKARQNRNKYSSEFNRGYGDVAGSSDDPFYARTFRDSDNDRDYDINTFSEERNNVLSTTSPNWMSSKHHVKEYDDTSTDRSKQTIKLDDKEEEISHTTRLSVQIPKISLSQTASTCKYLKINNEFLFSPFLPPPAPIM
jgi:hypothetical protein